MRTTVRLDEKLLKEAKRQAAEAGITLTAIIEESLRERLARKKATKTRAITRLHTSGRGGLRSGIDLDDSATLLDAMEHKS
ncbi:MAG TPA: ribbon-helix-helix protein, CopG family [Pseudomonadales bacterium]